MGGSLLIYSSFAGAGAGAGAAETPDAEATDGAADGAPLGASCAPLPAGGASSDWLDAGLGSVEGPLALRDPATDPAAEPGRRSDEIGA